MNRNWLSILGVFGLAAAATFYAGPASACDQLVPDGGFESGDNGGWFFAGSAGIDRGLGYSYSGRNNGWVRNTNGWNAVNEWVGVQPWTNYYVTARIRSSPQLQYGQAYMSIRGTPENQGFRVLNETKVYPTACGYQLWSFTFNSGPDDHVLFYAGLWGNGTDEWIQVDDVTIQPDACAEHVGETCQE